MLDFMIATNKLMPSFEQAGLNETDVVFVKELIYGELNESTNNQVRTELRFNPTAFLWDCKDNLRLSSLADQIKFTELSGTYLFSHPSHTAFCDSPAK